MKKKILISLLIVSFFNYIGCYSYYTLTEEEKNAGRPYPDEHIRLVVDDGSEFDCKSGFDPNSDATFSIKVDNPSRILIGNGDIIEKSTGIRSSFKGVVEGEMIDSSRIFIVEGEEYCVYWTKDNNRLSFKKGNYIDILPENGVGYYICKPYEVERKISFDEIKEIKGGRINWYITAPLIALAVAGCIFIFWVMSRVPSTFTLPSPP